MKKLAIYGDSFADDVNGHPKDPNLSSYAWVNLLKNDYDTTSYGAAGSSVYHSYKNFLETHENYDKIIFIITTYERWPVPIKFSENHFHIPSFYTANFLLKNLIFRIGSREDRDCRVKLAALRSYFTFLSNDLNPVNEVYANLMLDDIKRKRPDVIFTTFDTMYLYVDLFHKSIRAPSNMRDLIYSYTEINCVCHVSREVNEIIYQNAKSSILAGEWVYDVPDIIKHAHPFQYYYEKS